MPDFTDEKGLSALEKAQVLTDWRGFIRSGFRFEAFTRALYVHLIRHAGFIAHYDKTRFWRYYFSRCDNDLRRFLAQFGGDHSPAELGDRSWVAYNPAPDLNRALCNEMAAHYERILTTLTEIAQDLYQHEKWQQVEAALAEVTTDDPELSQADLIAQLSADFDQVMQLLAFELTDDMRDRLAQALRGDLDRVRPSSLFAARSPAPQQKSAAPDVKRDTTRQAAEERDLDAVRRRLDATGEIDASTDISAADLADRKARLSRGQEEPDA